MNKKTVDKRIAYYLKKVTERSSHHPTKALPPNYRLRSKRLTTYKEMMHKEIEAGCSKKTRKH